MIRACFAAVAQFSAGLRTRAYRTWRGSSWRVAGYAGFLPQPIRRAPQLSLPFPEVHLEAINLPQGTASHSRIAALF
jgi:hypothetical protein